MKTPGKTSCLAKTRRYSKAVCRKVDGDASGAGGFTAVKQEQREREVRGSASCERDG